MPRNDLNVKVDATTTGYENAIERAQRATMRYESSLESLEADLLKLQKQIDDDLAAALERQHQAMDKAGKGMFVFGAAVAAGLGLAANEAMKWESAWAGVTKTVDGTQSELAQLEEDLRGLATTLPATHEEIAAVAEAAGALGVERESVAAFTKTMIDLAETTNLTADEAATSMARFANIMGTPQDEVDRLGASLVALGNAGASTEQEILAMAMRIAGAGAQLGLSEGEVMGLANALSSVGIEAEAGGSAISMIMKEIQLDVSTGKARLADFARVAGMSVDEFSRLWEADAAAGLSAFISGLGNISASGGDAIKVLDQLEITQIRQSDALLRLSGDAEGLADSLALGNRAWDENSALLEEAAKRYETTEAKVAIARNTLRDAGIDVGNVLLPALAAVVDIGADMITTWQDLPDPVKNSITVLAGLAATVGIVGGAMLIAIPKIAAFKAAVAGLEAGALKTAGTRLGTMAGVLMGPWGLAIAGGIAALGIFAAKHGDAAREVDALKATLDAQTGALTDNSAEWAIKKLSESGALATAKELGISLGTLTDAALGNEAAMVAVNDALTVYRQNLPAVAAGAGAAAQEHQNMLDQADALQSILDGTNGTLTKSREAWELEKEAKAGSTEATKEAGDTQKGTTGAWEDGADAAGELAEEVKTLGEELRDLNGAYLDQRAAGRAVRDSFRQIQDALKAYRKEHGDLDGAFKKGSESGDEFAGMLDDLANDYLDQIEATEKATGSQKKTMEAYREARRSLIEVADQLGMTTKEAEAYADAILGTPKQARTHFTNNAAEAAAKVEAYRTALSALPSEIRTRLVTQQWQSGGSAGFQQANGGIVTAYANGGIDGAGRPVARVSQIARGGRNILWGEPETGWEAYISGKPGMESRNRDVWLEAGRRLGMVRFGNGGMVGSGGGVGTLTLSSGDIARLAAAVAAARPLYGDVHVSGDPTVFKRQLRDDHRMANSGGFRP